MGALHVWGYVAQQCFPGVGVEDAVLFGVEEGEDDAGEDGADAFEEGEAVHSVAVFAARDAQCLAR